MIEFMKKLENIGIMNLCYYKICCISKKYPPQKNENKFIYGKLVEKSLMEAFCKMGFICEDLDKKHKFGSEYKNDITLLGMNVSIKCKLNKGGNVILINTKSVKIHDIRIETILCVINERKIYFIPSQILTEEQKTDANKHIKCDEGSISYKWRLMTMMNKKYQHLIYLFPELNTQQMNELSTMKEIDIYERLFGELFSF